MYQEAKDRILFFDGGMGTLLQEAGLAPGALPDTWNLSHTETVERIHREYLAAGADIIKTNTFCTNRLKHTAEETRRLIALGVGAARRAVDCEGHGKVALDIGPTGQLLAPVGKLPFEEAVQVFGEMAEIGEAEGAELVLIETMTDLYEMKAAVLGVKEHSRLPIFATMAFDAKGRLLTGGDVAGMVTLLEGLGVSALGFNCALGPKQMLSLLPQLVGCTEKPIILNPNAGLPREENGRVRYEADPEEFARVMREMAEHAAYLGGCCGTTPQHIRRTVELCSGVALKHPEKKHRTAVCSFGRTVELGESPVIIGERINPTGKSKLKQALRDGDMGYILNEGVKQQQAGAHILDVNAGLPEIDEAAVMQRMVIALQGVLDLPLQIDTADPAVLESALRVYNGKALVNSVNGKEASMAAVLPLVKKYGGVVVALTLDENGIPDTAAGRVAIAERILHRAEENGIAREDVLVDALTLTVSTGENNAEVTLETLRELQRRGIKTVLGVSNVSFGLPLREGMNAAFLAMAIESGLTAAILNPCAPAMRQAFHAAAALAGRDKGMGRYLAFAAAEAEAGAGAAAEKGGGADKKETPAAKKMEELAAAVENGLLEAAVEAAEKALQQAAPLAIIEEQLMPALQRVGKGFETGELFLPQLLMSADAAKAAFAVLQKEMPTAAGEKGKVVLATVEGDIHDIGKNIVKVLLENYGYTVVDLGKDVPAKQVVQAAVDSGALLVGLSALMTSTAPRMRETVQLLKERLPVCRVMVGGAVLNEAYAREIGADYYGKDAMRAVQFAGEVYPG